MAITAFYNLNITISDGGTVSSLDYLSNKTYVDIGSGNILKISWDTPTATNNAVDNYIVNILRYDPAAASYKSFYKTNVGNVNEFYLRSSLFSSVKQSFNKLRIYVDVISKYGTEYNGTSNVKLVSVSRGCGTYVKITDGYKQPIMKRTVAFAKINNKQITSKEGTALLGYDGKALYAAASSVQDTVTGWTLMQEFYASAGTPGVYNDPTETWSLIDANDEELIDANDVALTAAVLNQWQLSDTIYEILTDINGEIITDAGGNSVYVL